MAVLEPRTCSEAMRRPVGVVVMEVGGVARRFGGKVLAGEEVERERGRRDLRGRRRRDCIVLA